MRRNKSSISRLTQLFRLDLFDLADGTDLDALSTCMENFIEVFKDQLLPVSPQLIARLVSRSVTFKLRLTRAIQCKSYLRVLGEQAAKVEGESKVDELETDVTKIDTDDKTFALMGISKTIMTVRIIPLLGLTEQGH